MKIKSKLNISLIQKVSVIVKVQVIIHILFILLVQCRIILSIKNIVYLLQHGMMLIIQEQPDYTLKFYRSVTNIRIYYKVRHKQLKSKKLFQILRALSQPRESNYQIVLSMLMKELVLIILILKSRMLSLS